MNETKNEAIQIANQVYGPHTKWTGIQLERLLMLADKFSAVEREACAKVCDELAARDKLSNYYAVAAKAIRERKTHDARSNY